MKTSDDSLGVLQKSIDIIITRTDNSEHGNSRSGNRRTTDGFTVITLPKANITLPVLQT